MMPSLKARKAIAFKNTEETAVYLAEEARCQGQDWNTFNIGKDHQKTELQGKS